MKKSLTKMPEVAVPKRSPCRLSVILAREANVGVILRRGPTRWVQVIRWDTKRDTFDDGAWFHGRIYPESCDLSPDGELFLYFAAKHRRTPAEDEYGYSWTAISRPPWLHALALWPNPNGTYGGGGFFTDHRRLTLVTSGHYFVPHSNHRPPRSLQVDQRSSWRGLLSSRSSDAVQLVNVEGADWIGLDQRGKLVFTRDGKLFRRATRADRELADFNRSQTRPNPRSSLGATDAEGGMTGLLSRRCMAGFQFHELLGIFGNPGVERTRRNSIRSCSNRDSHSFPISPSYTGIKESSAVHRTCVSVSGKDELSGSNGMIIGIPRSYPNRVVVGVRIARSA